MAISTETIKELRDKTGVSVMQCKKALEEAGGDIEKALIILKQKSKDIAAKKSDRTFGAGVVQSYVHSSGTIGVMVELVSETDFVAKNDEFKTMARDIAMHIAASNPEFLKIEDIPEKAREQAKEVFVKDVEGKPENIKAQILEGKLKAYFKERTLLEQDFIKNPETTIQGLLDSAIQKFGEKIEVARFVRFAVLEK
ncbi:elongation factor Ts [Candidatus Parcubacteria bacterium]|nr:elongation factor Ts [Candidatus Parcubacteria bacterium]